jgi:hypothetical protein
VNIDTLLSCTDGRWTAAPPATAQALAALAAGSGLPLPADYLATLARSNGGDGFLDVQPCYLRLWPAEEVLANNQDYAIGEHLPGFFAFGDAGGEGIFPFYTRSPGPWKVYSIPYVPMELRKAWLVAEDFAGLLEHVVPDDET